MDPLAVAKKVKDLIPSSQLKPLFGPGHPEEEKGHAQIQVFMHCMGKTSVEKRRIALPPGTPVGQVPSHFGRDMSQDTILDENSFRILDTHLPISHFSNQGFLNLQFVDSQGVLDTAGDVVSGIALSANLAGSAIADYGASLKSKFLPNSQEEPQQHARL